MRHEKSTIGIREAVWGLLYTLRTQNNFKLQLIAAFIVFGLASFFNVTLFEWLIILVMIGVVLVAELINTALEATVDLTVSDLNPIAKIVKDTAAAAVLLASLFALAIGLIIFVPYIQTLLSK
jgi:diacylglycerol kinase